ncbi:hypothetical protein CAC42_973 [Sphaceloma murrayae]|uniref:Uncharacterized protein n=1 Tax=Sphaceloma murrayae TaxID=2082308 RepID=A0A2K1R2U7_9PEZI|nr:hypothetical protein CAC42_973 [Sphaceloma murrayae]
MYLLSLLLPLALAAPVRSLPVSNPMQQIVTLPTSYTGPSISPEPEQDRIGVKFITESVRDDLTEVVEVLAYFPVGKRVYVHENDVLPCHPNKMQIVSVPFGSIAQRHVCVVHPVASVKEEADDVRVSRSASVVVTDADGEVDMFGGDKARTFGGGDMVGSFECF